MSLPEHQSIEEVELSVLEKHRQELKELIESLTESLGADLSSAQRLACAQARLTGNSLLKVVEAELARRTVAALNKKVQEMKLLKPTRAASQPGQEAHKQREAQP
jgi:hypothetical protein